MNPRPFLSATLIALAASLSGCAGAPPLPDNAPGGAAVARRILALPPADVVLLGEQHDAAAHQRIHQQVIASFAEQGRLAAVAIEMAERGRSTMGLARDASESDVQAALQWDLKGWPWVAYGPAVMTAVRAGVPVLGANLPRSSMRLAMADVSLDARLSGASLGVQQQAIRAGHCDMLPESQIQPMTRIQIARDQAMAQTVAEAAAPGKTVVLLAGSGHVDRRLGVARHLPGALKVQAVRLLSEGQPREAADAFDSVWPTPAVPAKDYCAGVKQQMGG